MLLFLTLSWKFLSDSGISECRLLCCNMITFCTKSCFLFNLFHSYLIKFLAKLSENADVNKMSASNIALVMGPNLLWAPGETRFVLISVLSISLI